MKYWQSFLCNPKENMKEEVMQVALDNVSDIREVFLFCLRHFLRVFLIFILYRRLLAH